MKKAAIIAGSAFALLLIVIFLVSFIFVYFGDKDKNELKTLRTEHSEVCQKLSQMYEEMESLQTKYDEGQITLEEKNALVASQEKQISDYQQQIIDLQSRINKLMGISGKNFNATELDLFSNFRGNYYISNDGFYFLTPNIIIPFVKDGTIKSISSKILTTGTKEEVKSYIKNLATAQSGDLKIKIDDHNFKCVYIYESKNYFSGFASTSLSYSKFDSESFDLLTFGASISTYDIKSPEDILFAYIRENNDKYELVLVNVDQTLFYIPSNLASFATEVVYVKIFNEFYRVNDISLICDTDSSSSVVAEIYLNAECVNNSSKTIYSMIYSSYSKTVTIKFYDRSASVTYSLSGGSASYGLK